MSHTYMMDDKITITFACLLVYTFISPFFCLFTFFETHQSFSPGFSINSTSSYVYCKIHFYKKEALKR